MFQVTTSAAPNPPPEDEGLEGIAGALAKALAIRGPCVNISSESEEDSDDDDWSD